MSASINNVINVQLVPEGQAAQRDNVNLVAILTSEKGAVLSSFDRYREYKDISSVANDFGTTSKTYEFASVVFSQTPNPINAGGSLFIGYHRAATESVAAIPATLKGGQITEVTAISALQKISDGSMKITINETEETITGVDFRTSTDMNQVLSIISEKLEDIAKVTYSDSRIIISELSTGGVIGFAEPADTGTFIGSVLALSDGSGAMIIAGADASSLEPETQLEAVQIFKNNVNFKGLTLIDQPTDETRMSLAQWANANSTLVYEVFKTEDNLLVSTSNIAWRIKLSGLTYFRMLHSLSGNRKMGAAYMARKHAVNFNSENTADTMHLKTLNGIVAEEYTQTQISNAKTVGLDIYTTIKNVACLLTSGANDFTDNPYNLLSYIDAVQTDTFNLLKTTGTKIPQTFRGVNQLVDTVEKTTKGYVRAGVFAPGAWTSPDSFGDIELLKRSVATNGYYVLAGELEDQPQSDRQARKSPVIQVAVKNAGAIHSADIIINFNY